MKKQKFYLKKIASIFIIIGCVGSFLFWSFQFNSKNLLLDGQYFVLANWISAILPSLFGTGIGIWFVDSYFQTQMQNEKKIQTEKELFTSGIIFTEMQYVIHSIHFIFELVSDDKKAIEEYSEGEIERAMFQKFQLKTQEETKKEAERIFSVACNALDSIHTRFEKIMYLNDLDIAWKKIIFKYNKSNLVKKIVENRRHPHMKKSIESSVFGLFTNQEGKPELIATDLIWLRDEILRMQEYLRDQHNEFKHN